MMVMHLRTLRDAASVLMPSRRTGSSDVCTSLSMRKAVSLVWDSIPMLTSCYVRLCGDDPARSCGMLTVVHRSLNKRCVSEML